MSFVEKEGEYAVSSVNMSVIWLIVIELITSSFMAG